MRRTLVIGASGLVGTGLYRALRREPRTFGTFYSKEHPDLLSLDATDAVQVKAIFKTITPTLVLMPAALADVDLCERDFVASKINVDGVRHVTRCCEEYGAKLVFLSTDYVFDGAAGPYEETDAPAPINVYGRQNFFAEERILERLRNALIIRTSLVYGPSSVTRGFLKKVRDSLRRGEPFYVSSEHCNSPTLVDDLVGGIELLVQADQSGIYHVSGPVTCSRLEFAHAIARVSGLDAKLLHAATGVDANRAPRPMRCGLKIDKCAAAVGYRPVPPLEGLTRLLGLQGER